MRPQLIAVFCAATALCLSSTASPPDGDYLAVNASCRDNPSCIYHEQDMVIDIVISNISAVDVGFPLAYLERRGPTVLLIDSVSNAQLPLRINLAPRSLLTNFVVLKPGQSVTLDTIIHRTQLLMFRKKFVDVIARVSPAVKIQIGDNRELVGLGVTASLRIIGADVIEQNRRDLPASR